MKELEETNQYQILDHQYRRKRLTRWVIRTFLAAIIYGIFWQNPWIRWSLWIYAPMNLLGLIIIFVVPFFLKKKQEKIKKKWDEL